MRGELRCGVVEFAAEQKQHRLRIDDDPTTLDRNHFVAGALVARDLERIFHAGTAALFHADAKAYRFIADSRDEATGERLDNLEDPYRLFRCHTIMNCADVCPKGLNPSAAIGKIKELLVRRTI